MKKTLFIVIGSVIFGFICIGITWLIGSLFGPLYQGEGESTRNFKIFLVAFVLSLIAGGVSGYIMAKKTNKAVK